jgi:hypothetical protein
LREKLLGTFTITLLLVEIFFIYPNVNSPESQDYEDSILLNQEFIPDDINKSLSNTPIAFTKNRGQLENNEIRFYDQGGRVWFTDDGVWFKLRKEISMNSQQSTLFDPELGLVIEDQRQSTCEFKRLILKQEFVRSNQVQPTGRKRLSWNSNFFYGNNPNKWCNDVPNYAEVYYENLYEGIDLRYYSSEKGLKYDFIVHPGAEINQIRIRYHGANQLVIDESGNLIIRTQIEDIIDDSLFIYQDYLGSKRQINGRFIILNEFEYGFQILDDYNQHEKLIIDPLLYSTFLGGLENETSTSIEVDSKGNAYITGWTLSPDFPTITGSFDTKGNLSSYRTDVFVCKLKSNGSGLIYSTFIGGNAKDSGMDIAIDSMGNVYITGGTHSMDFPTTPNAYNKSSNARGDCFVLKLNYNGSSLIYSTCIGGFEGDYGSALVIDKIGNAYVTGYTEKCEIPPYIDFPTTSGAYDETNNCNSYTAFIFKLSTNGSSLLYSTFLGGTSYDYGDDIAIDQSGNVYVTGYAMSGNFPTTPGAYDRFHNINLDVFVSILNLSGLGSSDLMYSTFVGGNYHDWGKSIVLDKKGNIIVGGDTSSNNFPTTEGAFDRTFSGGSFNFDCFIFKLNQNLSELKFSTYIGGNKDDLGTDISIDSIGNIYLTGTTESSKFPVTSNAFDKTLNNSDIFLLKLSPDGRYLNYSTFFGGSEDEKDFWINLGAHYGYLGHSGICIDDIGHIYLTGHTLSSDFPTTPGAMDRSINGKTDVFVSRFYFRPYLNITSLSLLKNTTPINLAYSRLCQYTFQVKIIDTANITDIRKVFLILDPLGANIQLCWDAETGLFSKLVDPNNYIFIESTSRAYNYFYWWTFEFNVIFNWTYPHENFNDVQVYATSAQLSPAWLNISRLFRVENDLIFNGALVVKNENNHSLQENDLVRGGEKLTWTGLQTVYENTTDVFPPDDEFDITIWDSNYNVWSTSPALGENFTLEIVTAPTSNLNGDLHIVNISGIPPECDKTDESFMIRIDGDNVTFWNPIPDNKTWQTSSEVKVGITITDHGGGIVLNSSVACCISNDSGGNWSDWEPITDFSSATTVNAYDFVIFEDGKDNFIKWCAGDSVGNGPTESNLYRVLVDSENVIFSNPFPLENEESAFEKVQVGITITDNTSGVKASRIMYTTSTDSGETWTNWKIIKDYTNNQLINVTLNLTFPNGTANRIKWRAYDIAGNGPTESDPYIIKVNTSLQLLQPQVELINPRNGSIVSTTSVELSWRLINPNFANVVYDVYFDLVTPITPNFTGYLETNLRIDNLINGETYYWTIVPRSGEVIGFCHSGIWEFSVNTNLPMPRVTLVRPENGSILHSSMPTFVWSVDYGGPEIVTYDIYLSPDGSPQPKLTGHDKLFYSPESNLDDNITYYWKIVPWAGNIQGPASEIWSFTIKKDYIPHFELELFVSPPIIELQPGDIKRVRAIVKNLGELEDSILLRVEVPSELGVGAMVDEPNTLNTIPTATAEFYITVTSSMNPQKDIINLTVVAVSRRATEYGLTVEEKEELTLKILSQEKKDEDRPWMSISEFWIIFLIIIIILIVLIIVWMFLRQKKSSQETKEDTTSEDALTVKPGTVPKAVISVGEAPPTITPPQLHEATADAESQQLTQSIEKVPTLAASTTPGQVPETQQIPRVAQVPQLPSAQPETAGTIEESNGDATPELDKPRETQEETDKNSQKKD